MASPSISVKPIGANISLKDRIYEVLKDAIASMDIYASDANLRLDERQLSEQLGISRTPLREALARLEQEGLVTIQARRGVFIVRKTKAEILEMITVWAALEGMAARLATKCATDSEIASLRELFAKFQDGDGQARIDEYSDRNIEFHQAILKMSKCGLIMEMADKIFLHVRGIRRRTIGEQNRASRSIIDHMHIIEALEARDPELAEKRVRDHALNLGVHVSEHADYLG